MARKKQLSGQARSKATMKPVDAIQACDGDGASHASELAALKQSPDFNTHLLATLISKYLSVKVLSVCDLDHLTDYLGKHALFVPPTSDATDSQTDLNGGRNNNSHRRHTQQKKNNKQQVSPSDKDTPTKQHRHAVDVWFSRIRSLAASDRDGTTRRCALSLLHRTLDSLCVNLSTVSTPSLSVVSSDRSFDAAVSVRAPVMQSASSLWSTARLAEVVQVLTQSLKVGQAIGLKCAAAQAVHSLVRLCCLEGRNREIYRELIANHLPPLMNPLLRILRDLQRKRGDGGGNNNDTTAGRKRKRESSGGDGNGHLDKDNAGSVRLLCAVLRACEGCLGLLGTTMRPFLGKIEQCCWTVLDAQHRPLRMVAAGCLSLIPSCRSGDGEYWPLLVDKLVRSLACLLKVSCKGMGVPSNWTGRYRGADAPPGVVATTSAMDAATSGFGYDESWTGQSSSAPRVDDCEDSEDEDDGEDEEQASGSGGGTRQGHYSSIDQVVRLSLAVDGLTAVLCRCIDRPPVSRPKATGGMSGGDGGGGKKRRTSAGARGRDSSSATTASSSISSSLGGWEGAGGMSTVLPFPLGALIDLVHVWLSVTPAAVEACHNRSMHVRRRSTYSSSSSSSSVQTWVSPLRMVSVVSQLNHCALDVVESLATAVRGHIRPHLPTLAPALLGLLSVDYMPRAAQQQQQQQSGSGDGGRVSFCRLGPSDLRVRARVYEVCGAVLSVNAGAAAVESLAAPVVLHALEELRVVARACALDSSSATSHLEIVVDAKYSSVQAAPSYATSRGSTSRKKKNAAAAAADHRMAASNGNNVGTSSGGGGTGGGGGPGGSAAVPGSIADESSWSRAIASFRDESARSSFVSGLGALRSALMACGSLLPTRVRCDIDALLVSVLRSSEERSIAEWPLPVSCSDVRRALYESLLSSLLSPVGVRPPVLEYALRLFTIAARRDPDRSIVELSRHALAVCEVFLHPRMAPPRYIPVAQPDNSLDEAFPLMSDQSLSSSSVSSSQQFGSSSTTTTATTSASITNMFNNALEQSTRSPPQDDDREVAQPQLEGQLGAKQRSEDGVDDGDHDVDDDDEEMASVGVATEAVQDRDSIEEGEGDPASDESTDDRAGGGGGDGGGGDGGGGDGGGDGNYKMDVEARTGSDPVDVGAVADAVHDQSPVQTVLSVLHEDRSVDDDSDRGSGDDDDDFDIEIVDEGPSDDEE